MISHLDTFQELLNPYEVLEEWLTQDVHFDAKVRLSGPTILDPMRSYCIYKGPHVTTPYFIHNVYELIAFMAHPRFGLGTLRIEARPHPLPVGFKMIPLPWEEVYLANMYAYHGVRPLILSLTITDRLHQGAEGRAWWST